MKTKVAGVGLLHATFLSLARAYRWARRLGIVYRLAPDTESSNA